MPPDPPAERVRGGKGKTVLVVDDDASICEMISLHLIGLGHYALTASDGLEAQDVILTYGTESIDLLLTDLNMPRMRGDELAEWFLRKKPLGHVLMMSSDLEGMKACKGIVLLEKPFHPEVLDSYVRELLANSYMSPSRHAAMGLAIGGTFQRDQGIPG